MSGVPPVREDGGPKPLARNLARARREAGLSQRELASMLGTSLWAVSRFERGEAGPPAEIEDMARITRRPVEWLEAPEHGGVGPDARTADRGADGADHGRTVVRSEQDSSARGTRRHGIGRRGRRNLVLLSLTLLVTIRFFSEVVPVLPRAANFVDVPILALLVLAAAFQPGTAATGERGPRFLPLGMLFLSLTAVSVLLNLSRVEIGPALVFMYGFLAPLALFWAVYRLWPAGQALHLSRLLVGLVVVQLLVVVGVDIPRFLATENPDEVSGTFGENAYQLVFFLLVVGALLAGIFTFERHRLAAKVAPLLLTATMGVVFLAQYRALLIATAVTLVAVALLLGSLRGRGALAGVLVVAAAVATLSFVAEEFPVLRFLPTIETLQDDPGFYLSQRTAVVEDVLDLYADEPRFMATGTGPGTYSSRAWATFALSGSESDSNVAGGYVLELTGGEVYGTDVSAEYVQPRLQGTGVIEGSRALTEPFSSYLALLAEVGVLGFLLMVAIYVGALAYAVRMTVSATLRAQARDPLPALLLAATVSFLVLLQLAFLENWLEVTRVTFLAWTLLAVGAKEFHSGATRQPA